MRATRRAAHLPLAPAQLGVVADERVDEPVLLAPVGALAVDRHRRGDDDPLHVVALVGEDLEHDAGAARVPVDVAGDLVHRLADADLGGVVDDRVDVAQRPAQRGGVAHVAEHELGLGGDVAGAVRAVHLLDEPVVDAHVVAGLEQRLGHMRPDEARTAGDEHARHALRSLRRREWNSALRRHAWPDCPLPK